VLLSRSLGSAGNRHSVRCCTSLGCSAAGTVPCAAPSAHEEPQCGTPVCTPAPKQGHVTSDLSVFIFQFLQVTQFAPQMCLGEHSAAVEHNVICRASYVEHVGSLNSLCGLDQRHSSV